MASDLLLVAPALAANGPLSLLTVTIHKDMANFICNPDSIGKLHEFSSQSFRVERVSEYFVALSLGAYAILAFEKKSKFKFSTYNTKLLESAAPELLLVVKAHYLLGNIFAYLDSDQQHPRTQLALAAWRDYFQAAGQNSEDANDASVERVKTEKGVETLRLGLRLLLSEKVC